jgi:putative endonuclease
LCGDPEKPMQEKKFYVYILTAARNSTFYVGVTSDLPRRTWEHKNEMAEGFTKKYAIKMLVYYETFDDAENAFRREKRLKKWPRAWKMKVIEQMNPDWKDLYETICS